MIQRDAPRLQYLDEHILKWTANNTRISLADAEVASTLGNLVFPIISKENPYMFSLVGIQKQLEDVENEDTVVKIAQLFQDKFNPDNPISTTEYTERREEIE